MLNVVGFDGPACGKPRCGINILLVYQVPNSLCKCAMMHPLGSSFHLEINNVHPTSSVDKEKIAIAAIVQLP